jgi:hypothetical protein
VGLCITSLARDHAAYDQWLAKYTAQRTAAHLAAQRPDDPAAPR